VRVREVLASYRAASLEATELVACLINMKLNAEQDVVLVDERGTGEGHRLDCRSLGSDNNLQGYFKAPFDPAAARVCRGELEGGLGRHRSRQSALLRRGGR
jgi:hypothetical protein